MGQGAYLSTGLAIRIVARDGRLEIDCWGRGRGSPREGGLGRRRSDCGPKPCVVPKMMAVRIWRSIRLFEGGGGIDLCMALTNKMTEADERSCAAI